MNLINKPQALEYVRERLDLFDRGETSNPFAGAAWVDRVLEIDYLTGDDAYKQSWMTQRRQRTGILACNPRTPRGLLIGAQELAGGITKRWRTRAHARDTRSRASPANRASQLE